MLTERHRHIGMDALFEPSAATLDTPTRSPATWPEPSSPAALTAEALQILSGTICPVVPCRERSSIVAPAPTATFARRGEVDVETAPAGVPDSKTLEHGIGGRHRPSTDTAVLQVVPSRSTRPGHPELRPTACWNRSTATSPCYGVPAPGCTAEHQTTPRGSPNERWSPSISHSAPGDCHDQTATRAHDPCTRFARRPDTDQRQHGGKASHRALAWAAEPARATGAAVQVVHTCTIPAVGADPLAQGLGDPRTLEAQARRELGLVVDVADERGLVGPIECRVVRGEPVRALLSAARGADLLVVGSRAWATATPHSGR